MVRVEEGHGGRLAKLDELATNLKRLERVAMDNSTYLGKNLRMHPLWSVLRAVKTPVDPPRAASVLDAFKAGNAADIGTEPLADLRRGSRRTSHPPSRTVALALVWDEGAGVLAHVASHVLSTFDFRRAELVPGNDVLSIIRTLDSATRELDQLKEAAKALLKDWLEAARWRLEV